MDAPNVYEYDAPGGAEDCSDAELYGCLFI